MKLLLLLLTAVSISWNSNTETDLQGYKVYLGKKSRKYSVVEDVGNVTYYTVTLPTALDTVDTVFCAVTAYDTAYNESDYSLEAWWTPDTSYSPPDTTKPPEPPVYPNKIILYQNYPNPSGGITTIPFYLPKETAVRIYLFGVSGSFGGIVVSK